MASGLGDFLGVVACGDAVEVMSQWPSGSVGVCVTSPPYNLRAMAGNARDRPVRVGAPGHRITRGECTWWSRAALFRREFGGWDDEQEWDAYIAGQRAALDEMMRVLAADGAVFWNYRWAIRRGLLQQPDAILKGFPVRQIIIWHRDGGTCFSDRFFLPMYQVVYVVAKRRFRLARRANYLGDVWRISQAGGVRWHPAPYPIELARRCIASTEGGVVADPYMGSGSTAIAAEACGRQWVGVERNPEYVRLATERIEGARSVLFSKNEEQRLVEAVGKGGRIAAS